MSIIVLGDRNPAIHGLDDVSRPHHPRKMGQLPGGIKLSISDDKPFFLKTGWNEKNQKLIQFQGFKQAFVPYTGIRKFFARLFGRVKKITAMSGETYYLNKKAFIALVKAEKKVLFPKSNRLPTMHEIIFAKAMKDWNKMLTEKSRRLYDSISQKADADYEKKQFVKPSFRKARKRILTSNKRKVYQLIAKKTKIRNINDWAIKHVEKQKHEAKRTSTFIVSEIMKGNFDD